MRSSAREVEDVAEVMQHIQSRLPLKEAGRTSVLSKSWLHAWSTTPDLRFAVGRENSMKLVDVDRTLIRYLHENIPIERFFLLIDIENQESASHAEKWIKPIATKTCLREFSLSIVLYGASFTLPDEILSGENLNLTKIKVSASKASGYSLWMTTSQRPVINCVSLRELHLEGVCTSEEVLNELWSSCRLLEKIVLINSCKGFKTVKVKNLPRLYELRIAFDAASSTALELSDVPNLDVLSYDIHDWRPYMPLIPFNAHSILLASVTQLSLDVVIQDNACLDMIKSGLPFLVSLTIYMTYWMLGSFHFTCASIKRLCLRSCECSLIDVQVHAPKLLLFEFEGCTLPSLLFPVSSLKQTRISLSLDLPVDANYFLKLRETLTLSRKCYLSIITHYLEELPLDIDIDDLRTRLPLPPARNVQELTFQTSFDECMWERSPFFDALFEICRPKHVFARTDVRFRHNNHFCRLMLREVLEKKTKAAYWAHYLKHVQIRNGPHKKWKTLTNSQRSFLDLSAPTGYRQFKLIWR